MNAANRDLSQKLIHDICTDIKITEIDNGYRINYIGNLENFDTYISIIYESGFIPDFKNGGYICQSFSDIQKHFPNVRHPLDAIGKDMKLQPYLYQKEAINFALNHQNSLLILPCGAGKTPVGIGSYLELTKAGIVSTQGLIIVKASLKKQWKAEVSKFTSLTAEVISTYSEIKQKYKNKGENVIESNFKSQFELADILIVNYETLLDEKVLEEILLKKIEFIMCDEIHYIKNASSKRSKALYKLNNVKIKIGATATPITKDPRDVYGIFKFIEPEKFGKVSQFNRDYIKYAGFGKIAGFKNLEHLKNRIKDNLFIKTKEEISSQLPSLRVFEINIDLTLSQLKLNEQIMKELDELNKQDFQIRSKLKSELEAKNNEKLSEISAKILALQTFAQELTDSSKLLKNSDSKMSQHYGESLNDENPKLDRCVELVSEIINSGEKVCIFSKFERMQTILADSLSAFGKIAFINGALSADQRYEEAYTKFRDNDEYKILLCSDAGAEGLNLSRCKYLIEYDLATSYAIQTQRQGRLERADSVHDNVVCYQLIANNSWDEIQKRIIEKKEGFDENIIKSLRM